MYYLEIIALFNILQHIIILCMRYTTFKSSQSNMKWEIGSVHYWMVHVL